MPYVGYRADRPAGGKHIACLTPQAADRLNPIPAGLMQLLRNGSALLFGSDFGFRSMGTLHRSSSENGLDPLSSSPAGLAPASSKSSQ